mmetsp:Transcript_2893/g.13506  ORF Transcript_2893/g.13506 Transcript_2893/m.13506 type:complete len:104 (-) Transcript_2893:1699-2010(-)
MDRKCMASYHAPIEISLEGIGRFELRTILNKSDLISMQLLTVAITLPRGQATANRTMSPAKMSAKKRKNKLFIHFKKVVVCVVLCVVQVELVSDAHCLNNTGR